MGYKQSGGKENFRCHSRHVSLAWSEKRLRPASRRRPSAARGKRFFLDAGAMRVARPRPGWLGEIADELEQTPKELDAKRELIEVQPTLDAKQPYSRTAFERLRDLYGLARGAAERKPVTPGGMFKHGPARPQNRTGWGACTGTNS